jgi:hypothetical protein
MTPIHAFKYAAALALACFIVNRGGIFIPVEILALTFVATAATAAAVTWLTNHKNSAAAWIAIAAYLACFRESILMCLILLPFSTMGLVIAAVALFFVIGVALRALMK